MTTAPPATPAPTSSSTGSAPAESSDRSLRHIVSAYREAAAGSRRSRLLLVLIAANGLLEGLALTALAPALNAGFSGSRPAGFLDRLLGITPDTDPEAAIVRSLVAFAVLGAASAFATFLVGRLSIHVRYEIEAVLRRRMTRALLDMPWLPFLEMRLGDITKTTLLDGSQAAYGVVNLLQAIGAFIVIIVFLGIALAISPPMTAFTLAFGIIAVAAYRAASLRGSAHTAELSRVADDLSREATEVFGAFKYVRGSGLAEEAWKRMAGLIESFRLRSVRSTTPQTVVRLLYEAGGILFVAGFLAFSLLATSAEIGTSLVFLAVFYRLTPRITVMNDSLYMARVLLPWYESWRAVFRRARANADVPRGDLRPERFDAITGRDLSFSYPTRGTVLSDVSVELRKGTCTAIVGESGSGKTTLMDLLTGLVEPDAGSVSVDGVALQEIDLDWWRRQLGLVMQDSALFSGSVAENVAIGDAEPDRERVLRCLDMAAAKDFVLAMPDGIDTHVGERGSKLSGGQRQRLALARALYRDPGLLCLDEATAALDGESEALILDAVSRVKRDRAVLLVSHRVRTLTVADHIVFLDDGVVVESGSWEELMSAPTRFRRLVDSQS